ncbi:hypothetical protein BJF92_13910 [Rhizobium rhizosphaerae]|uniref:N-acetyltransferase domain-containing protein n=1 Tax=Xaviernesmea rhizosphaerae TaxID=1672749 RepID=A0A1Q9AI70_9HYPH|nr:GNAT family N-acetyltransferase [Xaviernesmea rhizosphaerae]OLP54894.1 hypothetical protein BJF92_13910 [Xaviernesmea rhizosphaerae]
MGQARPRTTDIRQATDQDIEALRAIDPLLLREGDRSRHLVHAVAAGQCHILQEGSAACAYGVLTDQFFHQRFIALLIVADERRNRGLGTIMLRHLRALCPTAKLFTSTNLSNVGMQRLLLREGFIQSGVILHLDENDPELVFHSPACSAGPFKAPEDGF